MSPHAVPARLRVLHVDAAREMRGGERQLLLLAAGLRARGAEPLIAARPGSQLLHRLKAEGLASAALQMRSDLDLLAIRRLRRLVTTWRPDLVHAHDPRSHALSLAALLGRRHPIPLVVTRRGAAQPRGAIRHGARVALFLAISEAVRDALRAGGIAAERIEVVYPGVPAHLSVDPRDWRRECDWPADLVVAGVAGPLTQTRGAADVTRLAAALPARVAARVGLVLLGGPASGRGQTAGVRTFRAGFVHEVPRALAGLDLLLHPVGAEGFGTAVIEAMALGVPTIAFAAGGMTEIVATGRDGILVPPGEYAAFTDAIEHLVDDAALRARLGRAGPASAERFTPERMLDATFAAYRDLLERSPV